jgi:hypothetical protein
LVLHPSRLLCARLLMKSLTRGAICLSGAASRCRGLLSHWR